MLLPDSTMSSNPSNYSDFNNSYYESAVDFATTTQLTDIQKELIEKFNCAFYEAQNPRDADEILETFDETYFTNIDEHGFPEENDFLLDFLTTKSDEGFSELVTPSSDCTSTFDYDDFSENFEQFNTTSDDLSEPNLDIDIFCNNNCDYVLPPVTSLVKNNIEFTNFIRNQDDSTLILQEADVKTGNFGHLFAYNNFNSQQDYNLNEVFYENEDNNQLVLNQHDALIYDDSLLHSFGKRERKDTTCSEESCDSEDLNITNLQCKWEECFQIYDSQSSLVKHIEKTHVELKKGDEFTCLWIDCPRQNKPFNARYKLLIHMRVHSGEKPNKCPFRGCDKAFSRLENLKIHQRSHTGERPYICQFTHCTKSFSNSSDRAKHQRTHYDTKPYACQIYGCLKKYTDPSSLRKHVKNHTPEEQMQLKKRSTVFKKDDQPRKGANKKCNVQVVKVVEMNDNYYNLDHNYTHTSNGTNNIRQDLMNKLSEKINKNALQALH